jgi:branched-chain amino acid transport system substrate-binding protein
VQQEQQSEKIRIGFVGPLSGDSANFGLPARNTFEIAINEANERLGWKRFEGVYEDGKCTGKDAITAVQKLLSIDRVDALAIVCSAETEAVLPIAENNKILTMSLDTNPLLPARKYTFRNCYTDEEVALIAAETMSKNASKVGIIYEITSYPVGLKDAIRRQFKALNGTVFEEGYDQNSKDMRTQLTKILSQNPDAIFIDPDTTATGIAALQQTRQLGFRGQIYGNYFGTGSDVTQMPEAEGMIFFSDPAVAESQTKKKLFEKYTALYGKTPDFEYWAATSYDMANVIVMTVENVGTDPDSMSEFVHSSRFSGVLGNYTFDEKGDMKGLSPSVNRIINKTIVRYEG